MKGYSRKEHALKEKRVITALCFSFCAGEANGCTWIQLSKHGSQVPPLQPVRMFAFVCLARSFSVILSTQLLSSSFSFLRISVLPTRSFLSLSLSLICELEVLEGKSTLHCHCSRWMKIDLNLTKGKLAALGWKGDPGK